MLKRRTVVSMYIIALALMAFTAVQCGSNGNEAEISPPAPASTEGKWLNLGDSAHYVGMDACRQCHEDKYQTYIHTGMGQSFGLATPARSAGDFHRNKPIYDKFKDLYYFPYFKDSSLMLKEFRLKGKDTIYSRTELINYIIGSGHHTNSHIMNVNGYLNQAPFTYYVQAGEWDLPPGFENGYNTRFGRELGVECLSCHNGYPEAVAGSFNKYAKVPLGIDCERCHGPGSLHIAAKLRGEIVDIAHNTDYSIVNPRKLPYDVQIDVCQRCHLQGNAVLKEGRSFFDFRPGMRLKDVMDVYLPVYENQEQGFLMASHAERLQKSQCFLQTVDWQKEGGGLTCITCHNPHISVKETKDEYFISKCRNCHAQPHIAQPEILASEKGNCLTCHMPRSSAVDIPHITITDHYIRVKKDVPMNVVGVGKFKGLTAVNNNSPDAVSKARAYMYFYEKFDHKPYHLDSAYRFLSGLSENDQRPLYIYYYYLKEDYRRLTAIAARGNFPYKEAITNYQAGQAYMNLAQPEEALKYIAEAARLKPYDLDYRLKLGTLYLQLQEMAKARQEFEFVKKENPELAAVWNNIAFLDLVEGDNANAEQGIAKALSLDPDYEPALINRAKLLIARQNLKGAKVILNDIRKKYPDSRDAKLLLDLLKQQGI